MQFYTGKSLYLSPSDYLTLVVMQPIDSTAGTIEPGTRLIDLFPDGIRAILDPGTGEVISVENFPVVEQAAIQGRQH